MSDNAIPRTANIHFTASEQTIIRQKTSNNEWEAAIGYLASWNPLFPIVDIYSDGKTDMIAVYKHADGKHGYTIGAVWNGERYTFHS